MHPRAGAAQVGRTDLHEIKDRDSLKAWLDALTREDADQEKEAQRIAVAIAHRAAM